HAIRCGSAGEIDPPRGHHGPGVSAGSRRVSDEPAQRAPVARAGRARAKAAGKRRIPRNRARRLAKAPPCVFNERIGQHAKSHTRFLTMVKRLVWSLTLMGAIAALGWILEQALYAQDTGKPPDWKHGLNLPVRKAGETDITDKTQRLGVEAFVDK